MLLKYSQALTKTELNRSIKKYVFEDMRKDPKKDDISKVIQTIEALIIDENSSWQYNGKQATVTHTKQEEREKEEKVLSFKLY